MRRLGLHAAQSTPHVLASAGLSAALHAAVLGFAIHEAPRSPQSIRDGVVLPALYLPPPNRSPGDAVKPNEWGALGDQWISSRLRGPPAKPPPGVSPAIPSGRRGALAGSPPTEAFGLGDSVFSELWVDSAVTRMEGSGAPLYPAEMLRNQVDGIVFAQFVVDTAGRVDRRTVRILTSTDPLFTAAVQEALVEMQFRPAVYANHRVPQLVEEHFLFTITAPAALVPTPSPSHGTSFAP